MSGFRRWLESLGEIGHQRSLGISKIYKPPPPGSPPSTYFSAPGPKRACKHLDKKKLLCHHPGPKGGKKCRYVLNRTPDCHCYSGDETSICNRFNSRYHSCSIGCSLEDIERSGRCPFVLQGGDCPYYDDPSAEGFKI